MANELRDVFRAAGQGIEPARQVLSGWLVDFEETGNAAVTGEPGQVYVLVDRENTTEGGDVVKAFGGIRPVPGWPVRLSTSRERPWEYKVLEIDYEAMGGGIDQQTSVDHHHETHEWGHPSGSDDVVYPRFLQLYDFGIWPGAGLSVNVGNGIFDPSGTKNQLSYTNLSLLAYRPDYDQRFVLICLSPSGTFEILPGEIKPFLTISDIPEAPTDDLWELAAVRIRAIDSSITQTPTNQNIYDLRFASIGWPPGSSLTVPDHDHTGDAGDGGQLDHGAALSAASLADDDHQQYLLINGTRAMTGDLDMDTHQVKWTPGSDTDVTMLQVIVTDTPTMSWDESEDLFRINKGIYFEDDDPIFKMIAAAAEYVLTQSSQQLFLERQDAGNPCAFYLSTNDGDGTDDVSFGVFGVGSVAAGLVNYEWLKQQWDSGAGYYKFGTESGGSGSDRALRLYAGAGNDPQLVLNTSGQVGVGVDPSYRFHVLYDYAGTTAQTAAYIDTTWTPGGNVGVVYPTAMTLIPTFNQAHAVGGGFLTAFRCFVESSGATGINVRNIDLRNTNSGAGTVATSDAVHIRTAVNSGGGAITTNRGVYIEDQTVGGSNYGIQSVISAAANRWNLYISGTAPNYYGGDSYIGTTTLLAANGGKVLVFGDNTNDPTPGANTCGFYGKDVAGTVEAFAIDEAGNQAQLTSHNFSLFDPSPDALYPFSLFYRNEFLGAEINVDLYGAIRAIEELTGGKFIFERTFEKMEVPPEKLARLPGWMKDRI